MRQLHPKPPVRCAYLGNSQLRPPCGFGGGGSFLEGSLFGSSQVKNYSPENMEQAPSRGHEASPQSGLDGGCKRRFSSSKPHELIVRVQARRIIIYISFSVAEVSSFLSPSRRATWRGACKFNTEFW